MSRGMIPADLFRMQWVSDAHIAPDGRTLAFTVTHLDEGADDYRSAIWVVPADGSAPPRRFTNGGGKDSAPRWSPDGTRFVTVVRTGGEDQGSTQNSHKPKTPPARLITVLKYRSNGEGFTYDRRRHLFVIDAARGETRQLTQGDWDDTQPAWSPDSRRLVFVSARHPDRDYDRATDIFVVDAEGGEPIQVTPGGGVGALPVWSPDGRSIAYLGYADAEDTPRNSRLWLVPAAGGSPRCLTAHLDRDLAITETAAPIWQADGSAIIVGVQDRGSVGVIQV